MCPTKPMTPSSNATGSSNATVASQRKPPTDGGTLASAGLRRSIYAILITISTGLVLGRILAVASIDRIGTESFIVKTELAKQQTAVKQAGQPFDAVAAEAKIREKVSLQRPFLSANDRSRFAAMRAMVELGVFQIDEIIQQPNWDTIDMVQHRDRTGQPHLYSSKPPLLTMFYAAPYWVVVKVTGISLATHPFELGRALIVFYNALPLIGYFCALAWLIERLGKSDWGKVFTMAAACFATFITTFAVVLNNHLPAAVTFAFTLIPLVKILVDGERHWKYFLWAGVGTAMLFICELPALAFVVLVTVLLLWIAPRATLIAFVPAVAALIAVDVAANYWVHNSFLPPYAHRVDPNDNWYDYSYTRASDGKVIESYWRNPGGVDRGEASRGTYIANVLIGHHGIFSLTPIWLLSIPGLILLARLDDKQWRWIALLIGAVSLVVIAFYLQVPQRDRNYGGTSSGFRWVFWLTPAWLLAMLPTADWLATRRWGRALALILAAISALSASYPVWNPWTHPWLMRAFQCMGWTTL